MAPRDDPEGQLPVDEAELGRIVDAHGKWLDGDVRDGARAVLEGRVLRGAKLSGADLRYAVFKGADLSGADLSGANLEDADFSGATLRGARLHDSNLTDAILVDVQSLSASSLAGSVLTNTRLPEDVAKFDVLERTWQIASRASKTFIGLLLACAYSWLTVGSTKDLGFFTDSASYPLPILGTKISIVSFYWAAPAIVLAGHVYIHIYLQRLWQGYARLPAVFPDGIALDQKAYPWLLSSLVQFNVRRLRGRQRRSASFEHVLCVILAWWVVPFTLLVFWLRYLPRQDWLGTVWHILLIAMAAAVSHLTYRLATLTLREIAHPDPDIHIGEERSPWGHVWRSLRNYRPNRATLAVGSALALISWLVVSSVPARLGGGIPDLLVRGLMGAFGLRVSVDLTNAELSVKPPGWTGAEVDAVIGAELRRANLRYADARNAFLVNANLRSAILEGADLTRANLEGADMDEAHMAGADLTKANLKNVNLEEADLQGVDFEYADLAGSILTRANVAGASFGKAKLDMVRFDQTDLRSARYLTREQLLTACADTQPILPPESADLTLPPCPPDQGAKHRFDR